MENVDNIILEHLQIIRFDVGTIKDDVRELKTRISNLEIGQANIVQHIGHHASVAAQQNLAYDRLSDRVERLEKRLELTS